MQSPPSFSHTLWRSEAVPDACRRWRQQPPARSDATVVAVPPADATALLLAARAFQRGRRCHVGRCTELPDLPSAEFSIGKYEFIRDSGS